MRYTTDKDVNKVIQHLVKNDWEFRYGSKHGKLLCPDGVQKLTVAMTPSDHRYSTICRQSVRRCLQNMRKLGGQKNDV